MTTVALSAFPVFYDDDGNPLSGGKVFTYAAGTLNPKSTWTDRAGTTLNSNPITLDSAGRADIWLTLNEPYDIVVQNSDLSEVIRDVLNFYGGADPAQLTVAGIVPATGGTYTGPVAFAGGATFNGTAAQDLATLDSLNIAAVQNANLFTNSDFAIWQRATASVADGAYGFDRVVNLCDTGSTTLSQLAQPADGIPYAMRVTQPDASAKRFGFCQIVEAKDCIAYRGKNLVLALKVRCSATTTIRCALVAWAGTADAPTRDVVNTWSSTTYTAGNFFVASTLPIAVAAQAVTAGAWTDMVVSSTSAGGVVAPSTMNNLYLVVWTDTTQAQNVTLDASVVRCGQGTVAPLWTPPNAATELAKCLRYFYKLVAPSTTAAVGGGAYYSATTAIVYHPFPATMRTTPTSSFGNTGTWVALTGGGTINLGSGSASSASTSGMEISFSAAASSTAGFGVHARFGTLGNFLQADAEL